mmetsp:Transcript_53932/g.61293  ORF Transcript_53932/g.61293 Transcript_53932/m.61293 type:complete len:197 (-) Transcript_53932:15-605(-)
MSTPHPRLPSALSSTGNNHFVRVGVGVLVKDPKDPKRIFCGIRKGSHGAGLLALPGGHQEMYESWEDCAKREVKEECNLDLETTNIRYGYTTNDPMPAEQKHYVTIFMLATCNTCSSCSKVTVANSDASSSSSSSTATTAVHVLQTPENMEPEKCAGWNSYSWDELRLCQEKGELFGPLEKLVQLSPMAIVDFLNS